MTSSSPFWVGEDDTLRLVGAGGDQLLVSITAGDDSFLGDHLLVSTAGIFFGGVCTLRLAPVEVT